MTSGGFVVSSATPGVCHVVATFANGYTYSADVPFRASSSDCCGEAVATEGNLAIDLPENECLLPEGGSFGGWDAGLPRDASPDARGDSD
jgi:hypothetical protein